LAVGWDRSTFTTSIVYNDQGVVELHGLRQSHALGSKVCGTPTGAPERGCRPVMDFRLHHIKTDLEQGGLFQFLPRSIKGVVVYGEAADSPDFQEMVKEGSRANLSASSAWEAGRDYVPLQFAAAQGAARYMHSIYEL